MRYDLDKVASLCRASPGFALAYDAALAGLARLDERLLRLSESLRSGVEARIDVSEAQALVGLGGGFLHLNDLILFDADTNVVVPTEDAARGRRLLVQRRTLRRMSVKDIASPGHFAKLTGMETPALATWASLSSRSDEVAGASDDGDEDSPQLPDEDQDQTPGLELVLRAASRQPPLFGAFLLFDYWRVHEDESPTEAGPFLLSSYLKGRGLTRSHLPVVALGLWRQTPKWHRQDVPPLRMTKLAEAIRTAAQKVMDDIDRLLVARDVMLRKLTPKEQAEGSSRLSKLVELFVAEPLVTVELAARRLKISPQAVDYLFKKLGTALPREMTGRKRYRAWGI